MKSIDSLGFLEVLGLAAAIEGGDAMLKSAQVRLIRQHQLNPGLITLVVEGDLAACRAAVSAGKAAAARVGMVVGSHVIGRPDEDTESMILKYISESSAETKKDSSNTKLAEKSSAAPQKPAVVAEKSASAIKAAAPVKQPEPVKKVQVATAKAAPPKKEVVATKKEPVAAPKKEAVAPVAKPVAASVAVKKPVPTPAAKKAAPVTTPVAAKKPAPVVASATKKPITQAEFERVITYISAIAKGCSWSEIKNHFPHDPEQMLKKLNEAVASGRLIKAGENYRKAENKRS